MQQSVQQGEKAAVWRRDQDTVTKSPPRSSVGTQMSEGLGGPASRFRPEWLAELVSVQCNASSSLGLISSPEPTSVYGVGGLRTCGMTWKQNFKTNSLPLLVPSSPVWKTEAEKGQPEWNACSSERSLRPCSAESLPFEAGVSGGRLVSLKAVCPASLPSRICSDHPSALSGQD